MIFDWQRHLLSRWEEEVQKTNSIKYYFESSAYDRIKDAITSDREYIACIDPIVIAKLEEAASEESKQNTVDFEMAKQALSDSRTVLFFLNLLTDSFVYNNSYYHSQGLFFSTEEYIGTVKDFPIAGHVGVEDDSQIKLCKIKKAAYEDIKDYYILDLDRNPNRFKYDLVQTMRANLNSISTAFESYDEFVMYDRSRYTIERTIERKVTFDDMYDQSMAITKKESEAIRAWQADHLIKYHGGKMTSGGATPVSFFEIHMGWTGLGDYVDCVCVDCERKMSGIEYKNYTYFARTIG